MKDSELDAILKGAKVPERSPEFWSDFTERVLGKAAGRRELHATSRPGAWRWFVFATALPLRALSYRPALAAAVAAVFLGLGFVLGQHHGRQWTTLREGQFAEAQKCLSEVEKLFPSQVRAIAFDRQGAHLLLAEEASVPAMQPVYLKFSGPDGERRFVTFSGQRLRVDGKDFDVLVDRQGAVLVVGPQWVWSSAEPSGKSGDYRVEASALRAAS